jgi:hypothetical protein
MAERVTLVQRVTGRAEDDVAELECGAVHLHERADVQPRHDEQHSLLPATVSLVGIEPAGGQKIRRRPWTHVIWNDHERGRVEAEIVGEPLPIDQGVTYAVKNILPA